MQKILHSGIDKIYKRSNLWKASRKVRKNKGSGGVDGMSMETWGKLEGKLLENLRGRLKGGRYRSKPVKRCYIEKPGSKKKRPLGIPTIRDRVAQQATHNILSPLFEASFHGSSHGFRRGRSCHTAAKEVRSWARKGYRHVVDLDIKGFFDNVDKEILMGLVHKVVKDRRVLGLIRGWLGAGIMEEGKVRYEVSGTPQGGVISPLLSNIYLTPLDNALSKNGYKFVRYADDVVILCKTRAEADKALTLTRTILKSLCLELSEEKTSVSSFREGFVFLGFHFKQRKTGVAGKSLTSLYRKVREATKRNQGDIPLEAVVAKLNPMVRGWGNYHKKGQNAHLFKKLDRWIRTRLRAYVHKRWRQFCHSPTTRELEILGLVSLNGLRPKQKQFELF